MNDDQLIHDLFPHRDDRGRPAYRRHQFEAIRDTLEAFDDGVEDVVVEAPTGSGKTSIAVTVARVLTHDHPRVAGEARAMGGDEQEAFEHMAWHQAHLITSLKMLQDAYLRDDPRIALVKGKSNYECCQHKAPMTCDEAEQVFGHLCRGGCPYREARYGAQWAAIALHNFDSFLHQATLGQVFGPRRLLTIDESHNCEEKIRGFMTMTITRWWLQSLQLPWDPLPNFKDMKAVGDWARACDERVAERVKEFNDDIKAQRQSRRPEAVIEAARLARKLRPLSMLHTRLGRFVSSLANDATWVAYGKDDEVTLEPVDANRFVRGALMVFGHQRLHLSATFLNGRGAYANAVNLRHHVHIHVPSSFPVANRQISLRSAGPLGRDDWATNFPRVVALVKEILTENVGIRGVIHCTSYEIAEAIEGAIDDPRLLPYDREGRQDVVGRFLAGNVPPDAVLLAVSLTEGYDFHDDLCRFQIIVRVPFIVPTDCVNARRTKFGDYYNWRTALNLVQVYGRGVRSASDWCRTHILDERFTDFVERERDQLPGWFLEAIA